jgi:hypothetical protein
MRAIDYLFVTHITVVGTDYRVVRRGTDRQASKGCRLSGLGPESVYNQVLTDDQRACYYLIGVNLMPYYNILAAGGKSLVRA